MSVADVGKRLWACRVVHLALAKARETKGKKGEEWRGGAGRGMWGEK